MIRERKTPAILGIAALFAIGAVAVGFSGAIVTASPASAQELSEAAALSRGGRLYDRWFGEIGAPKPADTHSAYPSAGKQKGNATWRCKECHGWDYMGAAGAYSSGSHFSGIKGVNGMAGGDPAAVVAVLKDKTHGFGDHLSDTDMQHLALFVTKGQMNMDDYIDRASKAPKGDKARGKTYFETLCAGCHGLDGTKPKDMETPLGGLMGNPWEVMHKVMNGQPDEAMPSLRALDPQIATDILAHLTTLPQKK